MANPPSPVEGSAAGALLGYGLGVSGSDDVALFSRIVDPVAIADETNQSGSVSIANKVAHDAADRPLEGPVKIGGYASAAAPTNVSADADRVNAWYLRNGAAATVITAAGALIGGDAANGLDVDVTRVTGTVTIAGAVTNAGTFLVQENGTHVLVDDAAFTPATTKVVMAGFQADESATDSVDEGDGGAGRMTLDRKIITNPQPHTAGGLSTFNASGADGADTTALVAAAVAVKASAGQLYGWYIYNSNDEVSYVNFYNIAQGSVTVGTSNVKLQLAIPAGAAANVALTHGIAFDTAITVSATKTEGTNTAPDAGMSVQLLFK